MNRAYPSAPSSMGTQVMNSHNQRAPIMNKGLTRSGWAQANKVLLSVRDLKASFRLAGAHLAQVDPHREPGDVVTKSLVKLQQAGLDSHGHLYSLILESIDRADANMVHLERLLRDKSNGVHEEWDDSSLALTIALEEVRMYSRTTGTAVDKAMRDAKDDRGWDLKYHLVRHDADEGYTGKKKQQLKPNDKVLAILRPALNRLALDLSTVSMLVSDLQKSLRYRGKVPGAMQSLGHEVELSGRQQRVYECGAEGF
ncbi:hypothetical protein MNV49_007097 [Pseudohyphozyma bogoriensis]|nr:hypothetical protein MNV49_007097 [Pseudohyphozyma bogoriensis]